MPTDVTTKAVGKESFPTALGAEPSLSSLVGGIFEDAEKLIEHQFTLLKLDFRKDIERARNTGVILGLSFGLLTAAGLILLFMLVHLLEWLTRPHLEWWVCYAIVGSLVALAGGVLLHRGKQKIDKLDFIPEQTAQGLQENLQWKTNPN